jgi:hypothetical protein
MTTTYLKVLRILFSGFIWGHLKRQIWVLLEFIPQDIFFKKSFWPIEYLISQTRQGFSVKYPSVLEVPYVNEVLAFKLGIFLV